MKILPTSKFNYISYPISRTVQKTVTREEEKISYVTETVPHEIETVGLDERGNKTKTVKIGYETVETPVTTKVPVVETVNEEQFFDGVIEITEEEYQGLLNRTHCFSDDLRSVRPLNYAEANEETEKKRAREKELETARLRGRRDAECYSVINRGEMWHQRLTYQQKQELSAWYQAWLDVTDTGVVPVKPEWI